MTIIQAAILGLIQGLTEFLPVSSSGHLVLMQQFFGITEPVLTFDIAVHVGTLLAVCTYFFKDIMAIIRGLFSSCAAWAQKKPLTAEDETESPNNGVDYFGFDPHRHHWAFVQ